MKRSLILLLTLVVSFLTCSMIIGSAAIYLFDDPTTDSLSTFLVYSGSFILTIGAMWLMGRQADWTIPSPRPRIEKLNLPLIVLALIMITAIEILLTPLFAIMPESDLSALYDMMSGGLWAIITGIIAAPILEEFLFRGIVQTNLTKFTNPYVAIIVASAIFGAAHMIPQQAIAAGCTALVIGTIFYLTGSLMTAVVIHMLNNGIAYTQMMFFGEQSDISHLIFSSDAQFWTAYAISAILIASMLAAGIIRISKRLKAEAADNGAAKSIE